MCVVVTRVWWPDMSTICIETDTIHMSHDMLADKFTSKKSAQFKFQKRLIFLIAALKKSNII